MGLLVVLDDFKVDRYKIATTTNSEADLEAYISNYEEPFLIDLLGETLFNAFKGDVVNHIPATTKYKKLYDPIIEDRFGRVINSIGMKKMIQGFIYFKYMREMRVKASTDGPVESQSETSKLVSLDRSGAINRWNDSIFAARAIQELIVNDDSGDYTTFNGWYFNRKHGLSHWAL